MLFVKVYVNEMQRIYTFTASCENVNLQAS